MDVVKRTFIFILALTLSFSGVFAQCTPPQIIAINKIFYFGALQITTTLDSPGEYYVEVGPQGFIPGQGSTPAAGAYLILLDQLTLNAEPVIMAWSNPGTTYDYYPRIKCPGGTWTNNGPKFTYTIPIADCPYLLRLDSLEKKFEIPYNTIAGLPFSLFNACNSWYTEAELRYRFTVPDSGYYILESEFNILYTPTIVAMKVLDNDCSVGSYNCLTQYSGSAGSQYYTRKYLIGPFNAGEHYDLLFDNPDTTFAFDFHFMSMKCPPPENITPYNIGQNSIDFSYTGYSHDTVIAEYGPRGFTPGNGLIAGPQGTVSIVLSSPVSLSGLTTFTEYDVYFRAVCGGLFTPNKLVRFTTSKDCYASPVLNCGDFGTYYYDGGTGFPGVNNDGAWHMNTCGTIIVPTDSAEESLYLFTPSVSDTFNLHVFALNGYQNYYKASYYIKDMNLGCNEAGFVCVGESYQHPSIFTPQDINLGLLTAGHTYLIRIDGPQDNNFASWDSYTYHFQLQCNGVCSGSPPITNYGGISPTSVIINTQCNTCLTDPILEYGLAGFTPGTGSTPGPGGTVITGIAFPYTLNGLTTLVNYDIYIRSNCTSTGSGYGSNFGPLNVTPCTKDPGWVSYINTNPVFASSPYFMCKGDSITMIVDGGGVLATGSQWVWYKRLIGSGLPTCTIDTLAGFGDSLTVSPDTTTYYIVRAEGPCGIGECVGALATVLPSAIVFTGSPLFCQGSSTTISVNNYPLYAYAWSSGQSSSSISISNPGTYTLTVTDNKGCVANDSIVVSEVPLPQVTVSANGPLTFCVGDSVILFATPGLANYSWYKEGKTPVLSSINYFSAKSTGNYFYVGYDQNGCVDTSLSLSVNVPCATPVTNEQREVDGPGYYQKTVSLYPNPSVGTVNLQLNCAEAVPEFRIFNSSGQNVDATVKPLGYGGYEIPKLAPGLYTIVVTCPEMQYSGRFIIVASK